MRIGIISDTHGFLDKKVFEYFEKSDEIWHIGDVGNIHILDELSAFKTTRSVYGNIDGHDVRSVAPENSIFTLENKKILLTHIAGKPPRYNKRVLSLIKEYRPHLLVCGHSHILKVEMDRTNNVLFMNPGAAGKHGFHKVRTLLRFEIIDNEFKNLEVVELGPRTG